MKKIVFMADSAMDLPKEIIEKEEITIVPFVISIGGNEYHDGINIQTKELYDYVEKYGELPKTAAISPLLWEETFKPHIDNGDDIFVLTIGKEISSTFQNANIAKNAFPEGRIAVVDSEALSGSIALIMLKALKYREEGKNLQEIVSAVKEIIPKVQTQFVIPSLDYLHKGGRCGGLTKFVGNMLSIKPQIKMINGKMDVHKKSMGKMSRAVDLMLEDFFLLAKENKLDLENVFITHSIADKMYDYIKNKVVEAKIPIENLYESHAGSTISTHCGPGTIGILYIEK